MKKVIYIAIGVIVVAVAVMIFGFGSGMFKLPQFVKGKIDNNDYESDMSRIQKVM